MLCQKREERPQSAGLVAEEIEAYLAGAKERERRAQEAVRLTGLALAPATRYLAAETEREQLLGTEPSAHTFIDQDLIAQRPATMLVTLDQRRVIDGVVRCAALGLLGA